MVITYNHYVSLLLEENDVFCITVGPPFQSSACLNVTEVTNVDCVVTAHEFDARRRMISKNFHHVLRVSERQPLVGPPESMREHVVAACKAMKVGDWRACYNFIINEKMNGKVQHAIS